VGHKRILDHLESTIGTCESIFEEHGHACTCEACCITSNMVGRNNRIADAALRFFVAWVSSLASLQSPG
jgi:hypothetical protein